nr:hypothetical protein [Sphaerotilus sp.]
MALPGIPWRPTYQPSAQPSIFGSYSRKATGHGWVAQARASRRWAVAGAIVGALTALIAFAPAHWLAQAVASATQQRVLLANAQGTVWSGDAVLILGAGAGSRDARALPGRIRWTLRPAGTAIRLALQHDCCLNGEQLLLVRPGFGQAQVSVQPGKAGPGDWVGQWPAAWLVGLGTPWNTLRPGGALRLTTQDLSLSWAQ